MLNKQKTAASLEMSPFLKEWFKISVKESMVDLMICYESFLIFLLPSKIPICIENASEYMVQGFAPAVLMHNVLKPSGKEN